MPNPYKMVSQFIWDGEILENVFYFVTDGGSDAEAVLLSAEWFQAMYTTIAADITSTVDNSNNDVFTWNGTEWVLAGLWHGSFTGTNTTSDALPRQMAAVVIAKTTTKRVQGRKFIGGYCEDSGAGGQLTTAVHGRLEDFGNIWTAPFTGTAHGLQGGVFHKLTSTFIPFIGYRADQIMGTQRRRKHGVGI